MASVTDERDPAPPPDLRQRGRDREMWVGIFVIVGILGTLGLLFVMTDAATFRGRYIVTTHVPNAGGIRRGDPVQMRGVNIGRVQRFRMAPQGVAIRLEIEGEYDIPNDSHVELKSSGLLGGLVADIVPGDSTTVLKNGDTLAGKSEEAMMDQTNRIAAQVETVLGRVDTLIDKDTVDNVHASSADLRKLLGQLNATVSDQRRELVTLNRSLRQSSEGIERASAGIEKVTTAPELDRTIKRLDTLTQRIDEVTGTLDRSSKSLESVMARVDRGEGTLGKLTKDDKLYNNLNEAAVNFSKLAEDIRKQPKKYINLKIF
jgi:phospholipid/cholesterol/gamma-HCH transport system substrate-binding protein